MTLYEVDPPPFEDDPDGEDTSIWHTSLAAAKRTIRQMQREYACQNLKYQTIWLRKIVVDSSQPKGRLVLNILNRKGWVLSRQTLGEFEIPQTKETHDVED